jgi:two-component system, NarL family, response regulator LiaR
MRYFNLSLLGENDNGPLIQPLARRWPKGLVPPDSDVLQLSRMTNRSGETNSLAGETDIITVMLADDHPLVRQALKNLLETRSNMRIIAEAADGEEALKLAAKFQPRVIIMDIGMPVMNGLEATRKIKARYPNIAILVLTVHTDREHILGILEAGAAGYLTKVVFGDDVIRAIEAIVAGEAVLTPLVLQQILKSIPREPDKAILLSSGDNLTPREQLILKLAARGKSNKDIASELNLSVRTIKAHLADIFSKIGVSSRTEAVVSGLKSGILTLRDLE